MVDVRIKINVIMNMLHSHAQWSEDQNFKVIWQYQPDDGWGDDYFLEVVDWLETHFGRAEHRFQIESRIAIGDFVIRPEYIVLWPKPVDTNPANNLIGVCFQQEKDAALFKVFFQNDEA